MKYLLTSAGIKNTSIHAALVDLLGKPIAESSALCIPTAIYPFPVGPAVGERRLGQEIVRGLPRCGGVGRKEVGQVAGEIEGSAAFGKWATSIATGPEDCGARRSRCAFLREKRRPDSSRATTVRRCAPPRDRPSPKLCLAPCCCCTLWVLRR